MAENEIPLEISADTKNAQDALEKLAKAIEKAVTGINKDIDKNLNGAVEKTEKSATTASKNTEKFFTGLKVAAAAALAVIAGKELIGFFSDAVKEAAEADQNVQALNVALASTGEFSEQASKGIQEYAAEIQRTTSLTDDQVLKGVALAKSFGITNDQAKNLTSSAIELSAATGKDLDSSIQILGGSLSGTSGKLAKLGPEFKNLTEEQLKSGAAITLVKERFDGFSEGLIKSFSGAVTQATNNYSELLESVGRSITQNPVVIASINKLSAVFAKLADFVGENKTSITEFISKGLTQVLSATRPALEAIKFLIVGFEQLVIAFKAINVAVNQVAVIFIEGLTTPIELAVRSFQILTGSITKALVVIVDLARKVPGANTAFKKLGINIDDVQGSLNAFSNRAFIDAFDENEKVLKDFRQESKKTLDSSIKDLARTDDTFVSFNKNIDNFIDSAENAAISIAAQSNSTVKLSGATQNQILASKELVAVNENVKGTFERLRGELENINKENEKLTETAQRQIELEFQRSLQAAGNAEIELSQAGKLTAENQKIIESYVLAAAEKKKLAEEKLDLANFTLGDLGAAIVKQLNEFRDGIADIKDKAKAIFTEGDIAKNLADAAESFVEVIQKGLSDIKVGDALGVLDKSLKGRKGAEELVKGGVGAGVGAFFGPQAGSAAASITGALLEGPEATKAFVTEFVTALPQIIEAIGQALPVVVETLVDTLIAKGGIIKIAVSLVKALANASGIPRLGHLIGQALKDFVVPSKFGADIANGFKSIVASLGSDWAPQLMAGIVEGFNEALSFVTKINDAIIAAYTAVFNFFFTAFTKINEAIIAAYTAVFNFFSAAFTKINEAIISAYTAVFNFFSTAFKDLFSGIKLPKIDEPKWVKDFINFLKGFKIELPKVGGGSKPGPVTGIKGSPFATGGLVPSGFPNDTFPASLTSGELVIPKDMVADLGLFLNSQDNQRGTSEGLSDALLVKIISLLSQPITVETTAQVDGKALADIILKLNRNNARLSA